MSGFIVRLADEGDVPAMCGLLGELFTLESGFAPDAARQAAGLGLLLKAGNAAVFVADCGGAVAGMCTIQTLVSTSEGGAAGVVEDVVVGEAFRGRGMGTALIEAARSWARGRRLTRLQLLADSGNEAALGFYRGVGWERTALVCLRKKPV